jgi:hypothetical protein
MATTTAPPQRRRRGRPAAPGGRRDQRIETTVNAPERERHEAWLTSKGWPARAEADIVREALGELWQTAA